MKNITKFLIFISIFLMLILPALSLAANTPLVPCNNTPGANGIIAQPCDFNALMNLVNTVISFILFDMAIPIAAIMFIYAGVLLITGGGEAASARTKAKSVFFNAVFGLVIAMAAWLIIRTVLSILGYNGDWIGFPLLS